VIPAAEGDGVLRPVEEGRRSFLRGEELVPLPLALAAGHVNGRPPKDEEDVFHGGEAAGVAITPFLLSLVVLRGGAAVEPLEHVALLEGVVDWCLVVGTWLLQHVVENPRASRGRSRGLLNRVNSKSFAVVVVIAPLLARLVAWLLSLLAPLVLLEELLGLAALRGCVVCALAFLAVEDCPHRLFARGKAGGDVEQLVGVDQRAAPELTHEVPACGALEEGVHDLRLRHARELCTTLGEAPYEVPKRFAGLLGTGAQVPGISRAHVHALEVAHERVDQVVPVVDLTGRQVLEPRPCRVGEVQGEVADDRLVIGGSTQLTRQAVVVEPHTGSVSPLYLTIVVGWRKRWGKVVVRIS
jgi:hypothetical protein